MGFISVSIDLDELDCYHGIHGLGEPKEDKAHVIFERALPRAARFFEALDIKATWFVVGKDIQQKAARDLVKALFDEGHEIGNHTMRHRYDFTILPMDTQAEEIDAADREIRLVIGERPPGFRSPGYNLTYGVVELLEKRNYLYDSSVFPCPAYYAAKVGAIALKSFQGKSSSSVIGDPGVLRAPTLPYRIGDNGLWSRGHGLAELPITVLTRARLPFIGTSIAVMGKLPAKLFALKASALPFVNLELHGMDFIDADGDGLGYLKAHQTDLRLPLLKRRAALEVAIKTLLDKGLEPVTLADAAKRVLV
jgi:hypothetical protein